jgi:hypothetical protein
MSTSKLYKKRKQIKYLKEELEHNKKVYEKNIELLKHKVDLQQANINDYEYEKKKYKLTKALIETELKHHGVVNPIMEFHKDPKWIEQWKALKEFELETINRQWDIAQKNLNNRKKQMDMMINEEKIKEQQKRIEQRNPEIEKELKKLGVNPKEEKENPKKQDYIG